MTIILESFRQSMNESDEFIHGPDVISTLRGAEDRTEIVNAINDIDDEILKEKAEGIVQKGFDDGVEIEIIISKLINTIKDSQPDVGFDDFGSFDETNPFTDDLSDFGDESAEDSDDLVDNEPIEDEPAEEEEVVDDSDFKFEALIRHNLKHRRTASYERNILGESYDDTWKLVDKKQVLDYDGFYTEYAWYSDGNGKHIFMFGDTDIYEPDEYDADHVVEGSYSEAEEWFDDYEGFVDEDFSSTRYSDPNTSCKDCDSDFKGKSQKWDSWEAPEKKEGRSIKDAEDLNENAFSDMYDNVYVEFRDGNPTFAYETLGDASYGMSMSMSGDIEHDLGSHEYTIMKLEDGVYYPVKGYEPVIGINESLEEGTEEDNLNEANMFNQHYRYEVHAPRGQNYVVGGSKDLEDAAQIAVDFIEDHILNNPWEKLQDKIARINDMYLYDSDEDEVVEVGSFEDYVDRLLSELRSRKNESLEEEIEETDLKGIYFFNQEDRIIRNHEDESYADYYTKEEINAITIYPATPKLWNAWLNDENSSLWPVYDTHSGYSTDPVRCKDREEAREYLEELLNFSIYEYNHDI